MRTATTLLFFALAGLGAFAQEWKAVSTDEAKKALTICASHYRSENYAIRFEQTIYKDAGKPDDVIKSTGTFLRGKGKQYRSEQGGQLVIQTNEIKLLVDTAQQLIGLTRPDTLFDLINLDQLTDHRGWSGMTCRSRINGNEVSYQLTGPGLAMYQSIEFSVDQKTGYLTNMTLLFTPQNYFSESTGDETVEHPKVVIRYDKPTPLTARQLKLFDVSAWIRKEKDTYQPAVAAQRYTLQDYRYNQQR